MRSASSSVQRRWATSSVVRPAHDLAQGGEDVGLDGGVDRAGRVVEQQHPRVGQQRPGERDPLPLAAREGEPLLADDGVIALRQLAR